MAISHHDQRFLGVRRIISTGAEMFHWFRNLFTEYSELQRFRNSDRNQRQIVVYVESPSFWPYFQPIIDRVIQKYGKSVTYLTSASDDPFLHHPPKGLLPYYIGSGSIRTIAFATMDATLVLMTSPDLESSYIKKSKLPVHYAYLPHNMTSTHMVFKARAFNGFDTIFCVGPHQMNEHREAENIYSLKRRHLVESGYVKLDRIRELIKNNLKKNHQTDYCVIIAPTWGDNALINFGCQELVQNLLENKFKVIMRPHRISETEDQEHINQLKVRFDDHQNFFWAKDLAECTPYYDADVLITDWSGSAFSFALSHERPVLFIDLPKKVINKDFSKFLASPVEDILRPEMGAVLAPEQMYDAAKMVSALCNDAGVRAQKLSNLREKLCYREGKSACFSAEYIANLVDELDGKE